MSDFEPWHPSNEEKQEIALLMNLGRTYSEYYFMKYNQEMGRLVQRLSLSFLKLESKLELSKEDKSAYQQLKSKMKNKLQEIRHPKFKPGDMASFMDDKAICTVVSLPTVDAKKGKIVVDVLYEGSVVSVENKSLRSVQHLSRRSSRNA